MPSNDSDTLRTILYSEMAAGEMQKKSSNDLSNSMAKMNEGMQKVTQSLGNMASAFKQIDFVHLQNAMTMAAAALRVTTDLLTDSMLTMVKKLQDTSSTIMDLATKSWTNSTADMPELKHTFTEEQSREAMKAYAEYKKMNNIDGKGRMQGGGGALDAMKDLAVLFQQMHHGTLEKNPLFMKEYPPHGDTGFGDYKQPQYGKIDLLRTPLTAGESGGEGGGGMGGKMGGFGKAIEKAKEHLENFVAGVKTTFKQLEQAMGNAIFAPLIAAMQPYIDIFNQFAEVWQPLSDFITLTLSPVFRAFGQIAVDLVQKLFGNKDAIAAMTTAAYTLANIFIGLYNAAQFLWAILYNIAMVFKAIGDTFSGKPAYDMNSVWYQPSYMDKIEPPKAASGGYVEESGLAVIHKGENIVPAGGGVTNYITIMGSAVTQSQLQRLILNGQ
jgi:hypothetical protein